MTSQKSMNNPFICPVSLMREDVRHKYWMLALSILGSFLAGPVGALFFLSRFSFYDQNIKIIDEAIYTMDHEFIMTLSEYYAGKLSSAKEFLGSYHLVLMTVIAFVGAMIVAFLGFRFLYHRQMVDLYHSAPVSRKKLFVSFWLEGFLIWFVPALIANLLSAVIMIIYLKGMFFGTILMTALHILLRVTLIYMIVYHACLVGVMLSGNVLNALVTGLGLNLVIGATVIAYLVLASSFFDTFYMTDGMMYSNPLYAFSPLMTPVLLIIHWVRRGVGGATGTDYYTWHLIVGIVLCALNFFLAAYFYAKRPSELSERGLENKPVRIFLRAMISLLGGLGFAMIFFVAANHSLPWMLFGSLLGTAVTFCVLNVIFHGTFKEVISHKLQFAIVLALCIGSSLIMRYDLTGYDKHLPDEKDIVGISIYCSTLNENGWHYRMKDGILESVYDPDSPADFIACDDPEQIHALLAACIEQTEGNWHYAVYRNRIFVKVKTKLGSYYRCYRLSNTKDAPLLAPMVETQEYAKTYYPLQSGVIGNPKSIRLGGAFVKDEILSNEMRIDELMQALHKDFEAHRTVHDLLRESRKFYLSFYYDRGQSTNMCFTLNIPYWYENTIALVEKWYPNLIFDPTMEQLARFHVDASFNFLEGENLHDALYRYFGYDPQGNPLPAPPENVFARYDDSDGYVYWSYDLSEESMKLLAALQQDMIWGEYSDPFYDEYASLGYGEMEDGGNANCYIRYGKLPLEILQEMEQNAKIVLYDYDDEIYGSTNDPYYAEKYYID